MQMIQVILIYLLLLLDWHWHGVVVIAAMQDGWDVGNYWLLLVILDSRLRGNDIGSSDSIGYEDYLFVG